MKKWIFFSMIFACCISCNPQKRQLQQVVKEWVGKEVVFADLEAKVEGRDTTWDNWKQSRFKLLHYVDTTGCTSCRLRLYEWGQFVDQLKEEGIDVPVVFVLALKDYQEFEQLAKINRFRFPVLYDSGNRMDVLNHFPRIPALQTFLLDKHNRVVAIGDPVRNEAIRSLFRKKMNTE